MGGSGWEHCRMPPEQPFFMERLLIILSCIQHHFHNPFHISIGGYYSSTELSYVLAFSFFIVLMLARPRGIFAR